MSNDGVAKLSPFTHETSRLSDGHVEGVEAVRHRDDAVDAIEVRKSSEITLSHAPRIEVQLRIKTPLDTHVDFARHI